MPSTPEDWRSGKSVLECNRYILDNEIECDVTFAVGNSKQETINAHKYILMSRSSYFQSMLCGRITVEPGQFIPVPDVEPDIFKAILRYLYWEDISTETTEAMSLLYAANKFVIHGLVVYCVQQIEKCLTTENVCDILDKSYLFDSDHLKQKCMEFIIANTSDVLISPTFCELSHLGLKTVLKSDNLNVQEEDIFEAVIRWCKAECIRQNIENISPNWRKVIGDGVYLVRFPVMTRSYFRNTVSCIDFLASDETVNIFQSWYNTDRKSGRFQTKQRQGTRMFEKPVADFPCISSLADTYAIQMSLWDEVRIETIKNAAKNLLLASL